MGDGLGAVVEVPVLVPPAPIGDVVVLALGAVLGVIEPDAGAGVVPAGGALEPIAGPPPPSRATVCSSSVPV